VNIQEITGLIQLQTQREESRVQGLGVLEQRDWLQENLIINNK